MKNRRLRFLDSLQPGGLTDSSRGYATDVLSRTPGRAENRHAPRQGCWKRLGFTNFRHPCRGAFVEDVLPGVTPFGRYPRLLSVSPPGWKFTKPITQNISRIQVQVGPIAMAVAPLSLQIIPHLPAWFHPWFPNDRGFF